MESDVMPEVIVPSGIQVEPTNHFVGKVLQITMHELQHTETCQED
jgi:hypothetical protein